MCAATQNRDRADRLRDRPRASRPPADHDWLTRHDEHCTERVACDRDRANAGERVERGGEDRVRDSRRVGRPRLRVHHGHVANRTAAGRKGRQGDRVPAVFRRVGQPDVDVSDAGPAEQAARHCGGVTARHSDGDPGDVAWGAVDELPVEVGLEDRARDAAADRVDRDQADARGGRKRRERDPRRRERPVQDAAGCNGDVSDRRGEQVLVEIEHDPLDRGVEDAADHARAARRGDGDIADSTGCASEELALPDSGTRRKLVGRVGDRDRADAAHVVEVAEPVVDGGPRLERGADDTVTSLDRLDLRRDGADHGGGELRVHDPRGVEEVTACCDDPDAGDRAGRLSGVGRRGVGIVVAVGVGLEDGVEDRRAALRSHGDLADVADGAERRTHDTVREFVGAVGVDRDLAEAPLRIKVGRLVVVEDPSRCGEDRVLDRVAALLAGHGDIAEVAPRLELAAADAGRVERLDRQRPDVA